MKSLTQAETEKLLDAIDPREDLFGVRDHAMLELALHTGLRVSELVGLSVKNVSSNGLARETLHVPASLAKYSRGRIVPLNSAARRAIHTILGFNKSHGFSVAAETPLLVGKYHQRISTRYVQLLVQRLRNKAGIDVRAVPHSFRHTFTSRLAEKTAGNVLILKELLGHRRFETVQIYAHVSRAQLAEAVGLIAG